MFGLHRLFLKQSEINSFTSTPSLLSPFPTHWSARENRRSKTLSHITVKLNVTSLENAYNTGIDNLVIPVAHLLRHNLIHDATERVHVDQIGHSLLHNQFGCHATIAMNRETYNTGDPANEISIDREGSIERARPKSAIFGCPSFIRMLSSLMSR